MSGDGVMTRRTKAKQPAYTGPLRIVIYGRVSSVKQAEDGTGLDVQLEQCRKWAAERGCIIVEEFTDTASGTTLVRPGLQALLARLKARDVDVVLAYALDRLSRDQTHQAVLLHECDKQGVEIELVTEQFDKSKEGDLLRSIKGYVAAVEREKLIMRTQAAWQRRMEKGEPRVSGRARYGYDHAGERKESLVINPEQAANVYAMFDAIGNRRGTTPKVAADLNARGVPTANGGTKWRDGVVQNIIRNPHYKGVRVERSKHSYRDEDGTRHNDPRPESDHIIIAVPAIVDPELWERANKQLDANTTLAKRNNRHPEDHLLRGGFVRCSTCGGPVYPWRNYRDPENPCPTYRIRGGKTGHEGCISTSIDAVKLDNPVKEKIAALLNDPTRILADYQAAITKAAQEAATAPADDAELVRIAKAIATKTKQRNNFMTAIQNADSDDEIATFTARRKQLAEEIAALESERDRIAGSRNRATDLASAANDSIAWIDERKGDVAAYTHDDWKQKLLDFDVAVTLYPEKHVPRYTIKLEIPTFAPPAFTMKTHGRPRSAWSDAEWARYESQRGGGANLGEIAPASVNGRTTRRTARPRTPTTTGWSANIRSTTSR